MSARAVTLIFPPRVWTAITTTFLIIGLGLQIAGAWHDGPTLDEPAHLASGLADWQHAQFDFNAAHPPVTKLLAAAPVLVFSSMRVASVRYPNHSLDQVLYQSGTIEQAQEIYFMARLPMILLWLLGIVLLWRWAAELWGEQIGAMVATLAIFDPTFLGHGHLVNTDVPLTTAVLFCVWATWKYFQGPQMRWLLCLAIGFGLAMNIKFSAGILILILPLLLCVAGWHKLGVRKILNALFGLALGFLGVTWLVYTIPALVSGTTNHWNWFVQPYLYYLGGMLKVFEHHNAGHLAYLAGNFSRQGQWGFFPIALLTKTPWPVLIGLVGIVPLHIWLRRFSARIPLYWFWIPAACFFLSAVVSNFNLGLRHILPIFPFLYLLIGAGGSKLLMKFKGLTQVAMLALMIATMLTSLAAWPNSISYFNLFAGGTSAGHRLLLGSDLDWGQDAWRLVDWLHTHPQTHYSLNVKTSIPGSVFPGATTIIPKISLPKNPNPAGIIIISKKILYLDPLVESYRSQVPIDQIGSTILVYRK